MKQGTKAVKCIVQRLESESKAQDVANILAGPRREGWFNAEALVAVSRKGTLFPGMSYGEQGYRKVCEGLSAKTDNASRRRIPDLVIYDEEAPLVIIEAKLVYRSDTPMKRDKAVRCLAKQILEAKNKCPKAECIGVVYLVVRSSDPINKKNVRQSGERFYLECKTQLERLLDGKTYQWLRPPSVLRGLALKPTTLENVGVNVSLGLGAIAL